MLTTNPLTDLGISNLELLLLLIGLGILVAAVFMLRRRSWQDELRQGKSALTEARQQCDQFHSELTLAQQHVEQLQDGLAEAQRQHNGLQGELILAQKQSERLQIELAQMQRQRELDEKNHQSELDRIRALNDPDRIKEDFEHSERLVAHQFGSPLFDIAERCREAVPMTRADQRDLRAVLNDVDAKARELLQRSKVIVGAGKLPWEKLRWENLRTRSILQGVVTEQQAYAEAKKVSIFPYYGSFNSILTDRLQLHELCTIVVHNAITFCSDDGTGQVEISQHLGDETGRQLLIEVRDNGCGIDPTDHDRIFEVEGRWGLKYGRAIARLLGCRLELGESTPGKGSLFRIILPYGEDNHVPLPDEPSAPGLPEEQSDSSLPGEQIDLSQSDTTPEGEAP